MASVSTSSSSPWFTRPTTANSSSAAASPATSAATRLRASCQAPACTRHANLAPPQRTPSRSPNRPSRSSRRPARSRSAAAPPAHCDVSNRASLGEAGSAGWPRLQLRLRLLLHPRLRHSGVAAGRRPARGVRTAQAGVAAGRRPRRPRVWRRAAAHARAGGREAGRVHRAGPRNGGLLAYVEEGKGRIGRSRLPFGGACGPGGLRAPACLRDGTGACAAVFPAGRRSSAEGPLQVTQRGCTGLHANAASGASRCNTALGRSLRA